MKPRIDPKVDCVFKAILGHEAHKSVLLHFLNAVLQPLTRIQEVEILNPYNEREFESAKLSVVDVKARDDQGRWYQIEIQLALHAGLAARMLYTWSTIYHNQLRKGEIFNQLRPVIAIWLLNEPLFPLAGAYHLPFVPWNREYELALSEDFRIDVLQLSAWSEPREPYQELDRWLYLFREGEDVDVDTPPPLLQSEEMKEAMEVLQHFSENQREYLLYQQRLETQRVELGWQIELFEAKQREAEAKQREAQERREKERLLALLKQAGIDPKLEPRD